jgi:hypothetical protein
MENDQPLCGEYDVAIDCFWKGGARRKESLYDGDGNLEKDWMPVT